MMMMAVEAPVFIETISSGVPAVCVLTSDVWLWRHWYSVFPAQEIDLQYNWSGDTDCGR